MFTTLNSNSFTSSSSLAFCKKALLGVTLACSFLNPIATFAQSGYDIQQLEQQKADYELAKENLSMKMTTYMLLNPKASAAVVASGGGVAAIVTENLTGGQKAMLVGMGLFGLNHCRQSINIQKCGEVLTQITSYANQINNYDEQIDLLAEQINSSEDYATNVAPNYSSDSSWIPGTPHPEHPNVVAGTTEGKWLPANGYKWKNSEDTRDLSVIPTSMVGIGIQFKNDEQYNIPLLIRVFSDSPADIVGLQPGMYITKVDDVATQDKSTSQLAELIRGELGTSVLIEYYDPNQDVSDTIRIIRDEFDT